MDSMEREQQMNHVSGLGLAVCPERLYLSLRCQRGRRTGDGGFSLTYSLRLTGTEGFACGGIPSDAEGDE